MLKKSLLAAIALVTLLPGATLADDPVFVMRPNVVQLRANVLPQNAFASSSTPSNPSNPSTPVSFVFEAAGFTSNGGVSIGNATIALGDTYPIWRPTIGTCQVDDSWPVQTMSSFLSLPAGQSSGVVKPKVAGIYGISITCDQVNNLPPSNSASVYKGKIKLTVTP
jgi:hypothetical protein